MEKSEPVPMVDILRYWPLLSMRSQDILMHLLEVEDHVLQHTLGKYTPSSSSTTRKARLVAVLQYPTPRSLQVLKAAQLPPTEASGDTRVP